MAVTDIAPELIEAIKADFAAYMAANPRIQCSTYLDVHKVAGDVATYLQRAYSNRLSASVLPNGRMYYNIAERLVRETFQPAFDVVADACDEAQQWMNDMAGISLKPVRPTLNEDRVNGFVQRLSEAENYDDIAWILDEPVDNFMRSICDDSVRENAGYHAKAGVPVKIIRTSVGKCCEWCQSLAGSYEYGDEPNDVYRRHENCRCRTTYVCGGSFQDVWTKRESNDIEDLYENKVKSFRKTIEKIEAEDHLLETSDGYGDVKAEMIKWKHRTALRKYKENPALYERK